MVAYSVVDRPVKPEAVVRRPKPMGRQFIDDVLLPTVNNGAAIRVTDAEMPVDPPRQAKRLRSLFHELGYGEQYRLHIQIDGEGLTMYVSWR